MEPQKNRYSDEKNKTKCKVGEGEDGDDHGDDHDSGDNQDEEQDDSMTKSTYVYRDLAHIQPNTIYSFQGGNPSEHYVVQRLPVKLSAMLSDPTLSSEITWMPHGRSWKILDRKLLKEVALPKYFEHSNLESFFRLVNAWGFRRVPSGVDRNSFYHELFLRGMPHLRARMKRISKNQTKAPVEFDDRTPNFYAMPFLPESDPAVNNDDVGTTTSNNTCARGNGEPSSGKGNGAAAPQSNSHYSTTSATTEEITKPHASVSSSIPAQSNLNSIPSQILPSVQLPSSSQEGGGNQNASNVAFQGTAPQNEGNLNQEVCSIQVLPAQVGGGPQNTGVAAIQGTTPQNQSSQAIPPNQANPQITFLMPNLQQVPSIDANQSLNFQMGQQNSSIPTNALMPSQNLQPGNQQYHLNGLAAQIANFNALQTQHYLNSAGVANPQLQMQLQLQSMFPSQGQSFIPPAYLSNPYILQLLSNGSSSTAQAPNNIQSVASQQNPLLLNSQASSSNSNPAQAPNNIASHQNVLVLNPQNPQPQPMPMQFIAPAFPNMLLGQYGNGIIMGFADPSPQNNVFSQVQSGNALQQLQSTPPEESKGNEHQQRDNSR